MSVFLSIIRVVVVVMLAVSASSCQSNSAASWKKTSDRTETVYQPPLRIGDVGRVVRRSTSGHEISCGSVSPSYVWITEASEVFGLPVDTSVRDLAYFDQLFADTQTRYQVDEHTNLVSAGWLWDESWLSELGESFRFEIERNLERTYQTYSLREAECWAELGDQLSQFALFSYYNIMSDELRRAGAFEESDAAMLKGLSFLKRSAATPKSDSIEDASAPRVCDADLCPFGAGLPHANFTLSIFARRRADLVERGFLESAEVYEERAMLGSHGLAYYRWFKIKPIAI